MTRTIAEISRRNSSTPESDLGGRSLADRRLFKLGWHFWFVVLDLLGGLCFGGVASGQDCPGGQCPLVPYSRPWPAALAAVVETPLADYHRAIVRVGREDLSEPGASYSGTGTFVARVAGRGLVLTASHVVQQGGGRIWVDFGRGRQTASLLGRNANVDLAALAIDNPPADVRAISVAGEDEWPPAGESVEVCGFGGGNFRHFAAKVSGYTTKGAEGPSQYQEAMPIGGYLRIAGSDWPAVGDKYVASSQARSQMAVAFQPISGESGGAVLYKQKLAAVLWGGPSDGPGCAAYETHATCCIYIRRFLDGIGVRLEPGQPPARRPQNATPPGSAAPQVVGPTEVAPPQPMPQTPPLVAVSERLAQIEKRLDDLAARSSPASAGPAGPAGARGMQGLPGPAGKDADPAALAAIAGRVTALEKNLKGKLHFSLQVDSQTGKILSTSSGSQ
ncbi:MAG TPA: serine protease [Pirellulales bacterium]|jgi:hypothetical protein|nr:serine protease [Pirellulales bacterium]